MDRRDFLKTSGVLAGLGLAQVSALPLSDTHQNKLPQWRGFNLLDFFSPDPASAWSQTKPEYFSWMRDWGFDFVRLPMAYPYYLDIDRTSDIKPDDVYKISNKATDKIEALIVAAQKHDLHVSINLHRAPGYCVNAGFNEPYNLWTNAEAQEAFTYHWTMWAKKFQHVSNKKISFDLVNEPSMRADMNNQHSERTPVPGQAYRQVALKALTAIKQVNPSHIVIADGNNVGNDVIPEITDLDIAQSCRGYFPAIISHYKAPWAMENIDNLPDLRWPGKVGDQTLSREMLETYYKPWGDLVRRGIGVHCGECGCWNKTPHNIFLAWFSDVLDILKGHKVGFGLWQFSGDFGVLDSGRTDVTYEDWYGHKLDRKLLKLLMAS